MTLLKNFRRSPLQHFHADRVILNRLSVFVSLSAIVSSFFIPPDGIPGFAVCLSSYVTGIPCPGCGLTRSISSISHGAFAKAFFYHPFGFIIYPVFVFLGTYALLPKRIKEKVKKYLMTKNDHIGTFYLFFIYSFIAFGAVRFITVFFSRL